MRYSKKRAPGITALYERLSRDDDNAGESNSITHQKELLEDYARKHGYENIVHFTDDGWTGANFERPAWKEMIEKIKAGEIDTVIVKDLSRVGRDHLQVGFFTDVLFPDKDVHFIAVYNGVDSDRAETSEFAPFLNIMNEWYVRDTSKKIRTVLNAKMQSGKVHTSSQCIYGYMKDPDDPTHWIIDPEAASVVKRIFSLTMSGYGPKTIASMLQDDKVERPSYYLGMRGRGNTKNTFDRENPYDWRTSTVSTIISRIEYAGYTVNKKTYTKSYRDKKMRKTPEEERLVFPDTQEPIIPLEVWQTCQQLRRVVHRPDSMGVPNPLTGKVFCADCGSIMYHHRNRNPKKSVYFTVKGEPRVNYQECDFYNCSLYSLGKEVRHYKCTCHSIKTERLEEIVLKVIRETCEYVQLNEEDFVQAVTDASMQGIIAERTSLNERIIRDENRMNELLRLTKKLYEDNVSGRLPDKLFDQMMAGYQEELTNLERILEQNRRSLRDLNTTTVNTDHFISLARQYTEFTELTPELLNMFVSRIMVHEATGRGANRQMVVDVHLNYIGQFNIPQEPPPPPTEEEIRQQELLERKREYGRRYQAKRRALMKQHRAAYEAEKAKGKTPIPITPESVVEKGESANGNLDEATA